MSWISRTNMRLSLTRTLCLLLAGTTVWCYEGTCPDVKLVGVDGSDRLAILNGFPGVPGPPGLKGDAGRAGSKGDNGAPGFHGSTGPTGAKGEIGPIGPPGQKGSISSAGLPGLPGLRGEKGERGFAGNTGLSGAKGDQGERGDSTQGYAAGKNCMELLNNGAILTGWYTIYPEGKKPLNVLCDMDTDGGGWIVFQRRVDGSVDFYRDWKSYKQGFGSQLGEFWLGNENIHLLTSTGNFQLRFDLEDFDNNRTYATYSKFRLEGESQNYTLRYGEFTGGTAGDSLNHHNDRAFTTKDADNDTADNNNCAVLYSGAWWYKSCHNSNLNGLYLQGNHTKKGSGMMWYKFRGSYYSLKVSEIKFRPIK